jgi:zinc transport system substrate-binding protein
MDLSLAIQQAEAVKNALSARRPQHRAIFENNYNALAADLKNLDTGFRSLRADASLPEPVFSHPVYQYFQKAYGLKGTSLHWEPETPLNHDMLHEIDHLKKEAGIGLMIWERPPLPASAQALALKGIPSAVIQTIAGTPAEGDFLIQMEVNLKTLKSILNTEIP